MKLLEKLENDFILIGEGYVFELERRGYLKAGHFVPEVVLDHPQAVEELHREFLLCGSDVMEALTYYAHKEKLAAAGRAEDMELLNHKAIQIAKKVAAEGDALVAGNICNTWLYNPNKHEESSKLVRETYRQQVKIAADEKVDYIIAETIEYLGEALIALEVIKEFNLPAVVTLAAGQEISRDGYAWHEACRTLEEAGADVVGLNCFHGPDTMLPMLRKIREQLSGQMAALPVPYRTTPDQPIFLYLQTPDGKDAFPTNLSPFRHTREEMAQFAVDAKNLGINYIGVCCGGAPHHVRAMAEALGRTTPASCYSPDMSLHPRLSKR